MKTDIEIAQEAKMRPITEIAAQLGLSDEHVIPYGRYKAKIDHRLIHDAKKQGKLIPVSYTHLGLCLRPAPPQGTL